MNFHRSNHFYHPFYLFICINTLTLPFLGLPNTLCIIALPLPLTEITSFSFNKKLGLYINCQFTLTFPDLIINADSFLERPNCLLRIPSSLKDATVICFGVNDGV